MRRRGYTIALVLLVAALVVGGLTGCAKKAASRSVQGALAAEEETAVPTLSSESAALTPQATIVSVVTTPGAEAQPPQGSVLETPAAAVPPTVEPQPTAVPQPTDAPAPPPPSTGQTVWHTVARGETLASIALRYDTTVQSIVTANGLSNANEIYAGQRLKVPKAGSSGGSSGCRLYHTVQKGQWIYQIARTYGVTPQSILTANRLSNPDVIQPGTVLCIP